MDEFDEIVMKIIQATNLTHEEVIARINAKIHELSGLVSKRGAAHIVAANLGVKIHEPRKGQVVKLKDLVPDLNNISVKGVITKIFPVREFESKNKKGKVASAIINDGTGEARLVFWNDLTAIISEGKLNENDFVRIHHLRCKRGNFGYELHLSGRSRIELNPEDEEIPKIETKYTPKRERYFICDLQEGLNVEIRGCVVNIYDKNYFEACPECGKSVKNGICQTHGKITPKKELIVNAIIDDGTGTIRCIFFKDRAEILLGKSKERILNEKNDKSILGDELVVSGKVVKNNYSDTLEIIVNSVKRADPVEEAKLLTGENVKSS